MHFILIFLLYQSYQTILLNNFRNNYLIKLLWVLIIRLVAKLKHKFIENNMKELKL